MCCCHRSTAVILRGFGEKLSQGFAQQSPGCHSRLILLKKINNQKLMFIQFLTGAMSPRGDLPPDK